MPFTVSSQWIPNHIFQIEDLGGSDGAGYDMLLVVLQTVNSSGVGLFITKPGF
jgi:hypothetical protein